MVRVRTEKDVNESIDRVAKFLDMTDELAEKLELTNSEMIYALEQLKFEVLYDTSIGE